MATHIQSGERAAFASFAELEQFIAGWANRGPDEPQPQLKAAKDIDDTEKGDD